MTKGFKERFPYENRVKESSRIMKKYPNRIPIIVERDGTDVPDVDKHKYLVPCDLSISQFIYVIRKRINLESEKAIYLFINNTLPPSSALLSQIYEKHADEDGFLYTIYSGENAFGR